MFGDGTVSTLNKFYFTFTSYFNSDVHDLLQWDKYYDIADSKTSK